MKLNAQFRICISTYTNTFQYKKQYLPHLLIRTYRHGQWLRVLCSPQH